MGADSNPEFLPSKRVEATLASMLDAERGFLLEVACLGYLLLVEGLEFGILDCAEEASQKYAGMICEFRKLSVRLQLHGIKVSFTTTAKGVVLSSLNLPHGYDFPTLQPLRDIAKRRISDAFLHIPEADPNVLIQRELDLRGLGFLATLRNGEKLWINTSANFLATQASQEFSAKKLSVLREARARRAAAERGEGATPGKATAILSIDARRARIARIIKQQQRAYSRYWRNIFSRGT